MLQTKGARLLRQLRAERGLSQIATADLLECATRTITALELSQTTPRLELAYRIAREFAIPMSAWCEDADLNPEERIA